jgi:hypothetical protein
MAVLPELGGLDVEARKKLLKELLGTMLEGLAVSTEALELTALDAVAQKSRISSGLPGQWTRRKRREAARRYFFKLRGRTASGCVKSRPSFAQATTPALAA